jgi:hypothetical protein
MGRREVATGSNPRSIHRLSALGVARLKKPGHYCDGGGLYLQVSVSRMRSWVYRFRREGRLREMGLGPLHVVSLADARELAARCRRMLFEGVDPIEARRAERAQQVAIAARSRTFDECTRAFIKANRAGWKNEKHVAQCMARKRNRCMDREPRRSRSSWSAIARLAAAGVAAPSARRLLPTAAALAGGGEPRPLAQLFCVVAPMLYSEETTLHVAAGRARHSGENPMDLSGYVARPVQPRRVIR